MLIPGSFVFGLVFAPWWMPWAEWIMEHRIGALAVAFLAGVLLGLVLLRRHRRQLHELRRDPIHRWPPLPRGDLSFIRPKPPNG